MFAFALKKFSFSLGLTGYLLLLTTSQSYAAAPTITLESSATTLYANQTFTVNAILSNATDPHKETDLSISFDPNVLEVTAVTQGSLYYVYSNQNFDNGAGTATITGTFMGSSLSNNGTIATITFKAKTSGTATINGSSTVVLDQLDTPFSLSPISLDVTALAQASGATLSLSSEFDTWALNDSQWISINLNTQGNDVAGADIVLTYDPTILQFNSYQTSGMFPYQPSISVDQNLGRVSISGVANEGTPINAVGELMQVQFLVIGAGTTNIALDWTLASTTDTNIASYYNLNQDLLTVAPAALPITTGQGAQVSFTFGLLDFLGDITTKTGTIKVQELATSYSFSSPSAAGEISSLALGTVLLGNTYNLELHVPGYLAKKTSLQMNAGLNPSSGFLNYGNLTPGDINDDAVINTFDLNQLFGNWNTSANSSSFADLNGDSRVNSFDTAILYNYFNQSVTL